MRSLIFKKRKTSSSDPAPSRLAWRIERWMLTPGVKFFLRVGVPFTAAFAAAMIWLSDEERRQNIEYSIAEFRHQIETRPEFMVNVMAVEGAGEEVAADIRDILPIDFLNRRPVGSNVCISDPSFRVAHRLVGDNCSVDRQVTAPVTESIATTRFNHRVVFR